MNRPSERGFALLIVLWTLVFLIFLMTQILGSGRAVVSLASGSRAVAEARAAADGGIQAAIFHLLARPASRWVADGAPHLVMVGGIAVTVQASRLAGLVNPNLASAGLLTGLLEAVGAPPDQAGAVAGAIVAWRGPPATRQAGAAILDAYRRAGLPYGPPARPFAALGELGFVLGMTPDLLARLTPHLSLFQPGNPDAAAADPVVVKALELAAAAGVKNTAYKGASVVAVSACAPAPAALCRHALVSLPGGNALVPYRLLALDNGE